MKITDLRTIPLAFRAANPVMSAGGVNAARNALLVEIETDTGLVGLGEAGAAGGPLISTETVIQQELRPMLLGEDPRMIEALWQKMFARTRQHGRRGLVMHAISGIDIALWDLAGKATGQPLYRLLGGCTDRVEAYASGGFYQRGKDTAALADEAARYVAQGFRAMKMKVGRTRATGAKLRGLTADPELCQVTVAEDIARVAAVRKALGPEPRLMLDANCVWSPSVAVAMGKAFEPYDIFWLEEPVATDDIDGSAEVARALPMAIAGYETEHGLFGYRELITRRAIDIAQPDLVWSGGFSECRRIAALAHAHNMMVAPHSFSSAVLLAASLHFIASIPNGLIVEFDQTEHALRDELLRERITTDGNGMVRLSDAPGLGIALDPAAVERYRAPRAFSR
jgi:L-alanine-DL-glutamate epimerase-like enolase superfamily enzyme